MGNKVPKLFTKSRKSKLLPVRTKILIPNDDDGDDGFYTPKSSYSDENRKIDISFSEVMLQSGDSSVFVCDICTETRGLMDSFSPKGCSHFYCVDCIVSYIASKLDDRVTLISCPVSRCGGVLEPEFCKCILPISVFDRWGIALCESVIENSQRFYCPFKDCSVLLIDDNGREIQKSYCPFCKRSFCAKCKVPWHSKITCEKFQKLQKKGDGEGLLLDLVKRKKWRRCPNCKFYVEKSAGCFYIKCRCGYAFCYKCGTRNSSTTTHKCTNPKCRALW